MTFPCGNSIVVSTNQRVKNFKCSVLYNLGICFHYFFKLLRKSLKLSSTVVSVAFLQEENAEQNAVY